MKKLRFIVVGSGYRSLYYVRIAKALPERFELCALLCRTREKAEKLAIKYKIPTSFSEEECKNMSPDFVVIAVSKGEAFPVIKRWAAYGVPVLSETPAALELSQLRELWKLKTEKQAKIQVAEQYFKQAVLSSQIALTERGILGKPYSMDISMAHDYHGISLIRHFLKTDGKTVTMSGCQFIFPVEETDSRYGVINDGRMTDVTRVRLSLEFGDNTVAFYDFSSIQYRSFIRSRHLAVQGSHGEMRDLTVCYTDSDHIPHKEELSICLWPSGTGIQKVLWKGELLYQNPYGDCGLTEDETAIAELMDGMEKYINEGVEVYPLREALQDAYMTILMEEAIQHPYEKVTAQKQIWDS